MEGTRTFLETIAAPAAAPGGGSAAAYVGSVGIALLTKIIKLELTRNPHSVEHLSMWEPRLFKVEQLDADLKRLCEEDMRAYAALSAALSGDRTSAVFFDALQKAVKIPLCLIEAAGNGCLLIGDVAPVCRKYLIPDLQVVAEILNAVQQGAFCIGVGNLALLPSSDLGKALLEEALVVRQRAQDCYTLACAALMERVPYRP